MRRIELLQCLPTEWRRGRFVTAFAVPLVMATPVAFVFLAAPVFAQIYTVERIAGDYNQPVYLTQAPGDDNSLFIIERVNAGTNNIGRIVKLDQQAGTTTTFLDLGGPAAGLGGAIGMAFHPDYQTNGKLYVVTIEGSSNLNHLDEYQVVAGVPQFSRSLLNYNTFPNTVAHTLDWVGFRPGGNNNELFAIAGDGGKQANDPTFPIALIESTDSPLGKLMKLDLSGDFTTPAGFGLDADSRVDVIATGMRNPWRASFDSQGGLYIADVGHHTVEEINYMPADLFDNPPPTPVNFGWTDREGTRETFTLAGGLAGGPKEPGDVDPVFDYLHVRPLNSGVDVPADFHGGNDQLTAAGVPIRGNSIIGGYEFDGRYFFAEFEPPTGTSPIYSGVFNTNTPTGSYNGENLTDIVKHNDSFEALAGDDIDTIVAFGTDNAGNLYVLDYGEGNPWAPDTNSGEIFRVSLFEEVLSLKVDRDSKIVSLVNPDTDPIAIDGYRIESALGSINPTPWDSFEDQQLDGDTWLEASGGGTANQLAELNPDTSAVISVASPRAIGAVFEPNFVTFGQESEDLVFTYTTSTGEIFGGTVDYVGRKQHNNLVLVVDPASGAGRMQNESGLTVDIDGYTITSASGALLDTWNSLQDQGAAGGDWFEANPDEMQLAELQSDGVTTLNQGDGFDLGTLFNTSLSQDLQFEFLLAGTEVGFVGIVEYGSLASDIAGDYSNNGIVGLEDLNLVLFNWQEPGAGLPVGWVNFRPSGNVGLPELNGVLFNWQNTASNGTVPEPGTLVMLVAVLLPLVVARSRP
jgi:hypothetical protein